MAKTRMPKNGGITDPSGLAAVHTVRLPLWPYLVTPTGSIGLAVATGLAHWRWGDDPTSVGAAAAGLTLAGTALTSLTWRAAAARGVVRRAVATTTCVAGSVWAIGATIAAPWSSPWSDMWLIGAPTASIAMAVVRVLRNGDGDDAAGGGLADAVKSLRNAAVSRPTIKGAKASAAVTLDAGTSVRELAGDRAALASALDVPETAVRVIPNPDSARRGRVEVVPVDQLRAMIPWPGLSAPGRSIAEPIVLGVMEDGEPLMLWLPGDHHAGRNAAHFLIVGMSGAGKTEVILNIAAEVISRPDAELWLADPRKGDQLPTWARNGAARVALTEDDTNDMLEDLYTDITGRARQIGAHGHKQWTKGCRQCPRYRVVIVDEAAQVAAGNPLVTELTEAARSAGISLLFGLQRASHDRFPTSARANIPGSICLGVDKDIDAGMALSEATLDAGAMPWAWKNTKPGYLYAEVPGTDTTRWTMPCRSFVADEDHRAAAIAPYLGGQPATEPANPQPARPASRPRPEPDMDDERDDDPAEPNRAVNPNDPPDDVDAAEPIRIPPGMPRIPLGLRQPAMASQEAYEHLRGHLYDLHDSGVEFVRPGELGDVIAATGLGYGWIRKALGQLSTGPDAMLRKTDRGTYKIRIPTPA
ncbi:conjugal transfer protein TraB [Micromonospora schwarzwaldensis]|uniref:conjugal transfer protein TraB n=1 Tax=Micromonospora sp. DSM 45708 TaxID=3111767 RepID=UPI0031DE05E4